MIRRALRWLAVWAEDLLPLLAFIGVLALGGFFIWFAFFGGWG